MTLAESVDLLRDMADRNGFGTPAGRAYLISDDEWAAIIHAAAVLGMFVEALDDVADDSMHIVEWHTTGDDGGIVCDWESQCLLLPEDRRGK